MMNLSLYNFNYGPGHRTIHAEAVLSACICREQQSLWERE